MEKGAAVKGNGGKKKATRIKLAAVRTAHKPGPLDTGGAFSCVRVTVVNQSAKNLEVNPMYFSLVDTGGTKHEIDITAAAGNGQIDTTTLAPHEKAKGVVCGAGKFVPKIVAMTNPLFSEAARAEVGQADPRTRPTPRPSHAVRWRGVKRVVHALQRSPAESSAGSTTSRRRRRSIAASTITDGPRRRTMPSTTPVRMLVVRAEPTSAAWSSTSISTGSASFHASM